MEKAFFCIRLCLLFSASTGGVLDNPEDLPAWGLDIEERGIRVNHPLEPCIQGLLLQRSRIVRPQLQPDPTLGLLIRERIFRKLHGETRAIRKGDGIHRFGRMDISPGSFMNLQTKHFGEECEQWLFRVRTSVEMNSIAQGDHITFLSL